MKLGKSNATNVSTSANLPGEKDEDDKVSKELSEKIKAMPLHGWLNNPSKFTESNRLCLERELKDTVPQIDNYVTTLETFAHFIGRDKPLRTKKKQSIFLDKVFQDKIDLGMFIMERINDIMKLERTSRTSFNKTIAVNDDSVSRYQAELESLVSRFIKILDNNRIEHNLHPLARILGERAGHVSTKTRYSESTEYTISYPATTTQTSDQLQDLEGGENPIDFIKYICTKYSLSFSFKDFQKDQEHINVCELEKYSVSGRGRNKHIASIDSALKMVKMLMTLHQRSESLSSERVVKLENVDLEDAVKLVCQTENFPKKLKNLCELHTAHLPTYNLIREIPEYTTECKALGYTATGTHKNYSMSKRIAAFKLMEAIPNEEQGKHLLTKGRHIRKKSNNV